MSRGEIWIADLGAPRGSAPALRRPVVVISADTYNASALATVVVAVVTTSQRAAAVADNVVVEPGPSGLTRTSTVNVSSLRTLDRGDLEYPVGRLDTAAVWRVDAGLRSVLSL